MSFDDGHGSNEMSSYDDFRAKFAAAMQEFSISFSDLCERAGVETGKAMQAIERGTYGLPETLPVLSKLLRAMGLDENYLFGSTPVVVSGKSHTERRRELRTAAWDYILRSNMPKPHRIPFVDYCLTLLVPRASHSQARAARPAAPGTALEFAFEYQRLLRNDYFGKASK